MSDLGSIWERAQRNVPDAAREPSHAGFGGAFVAVFGCVIFIAIAGLEERGRVEIACVVVIALGYIGPYFHYASQRKAHIAESVRLQLEERARANSEDASA